MVKKRERSEAEYLRGELRKLKAENRHLRKELGRTTKKVKVFEETVDLQEEPEMTLEAATDLCKSCGKGQIQTVDLGVRVMVTCTQCTYRKAYKK
jgi:phosphoglycerate-specific signal transduction histidine kinase